MNARTWPVVEMNSNAVARDGDVADGRYGYVAPRRLPAYSAADERPLFRNTIHAITQDGAARVVVRTAGNVSLHDAAPDGRVLISHTNDRTGISVMAPGAVAEQDISWLDASSLGDLSRDGRLLLFTENGVGGGPRSSIYIRSTDGAPAVRLGDGFGWALSPDGKWAVASSAPGSSPVLDLLPVGPGEVRRIERPGGTFRQARWLPRGFRLVVRASEQDPRRAHTGRGEARAGPTVGRDGRTERRAAQFIAATGEAFGAECE